MNLSRATKAFVLWTVALAGFGAFFGHLAPSALHAFLGLLIVWVGSVPALLEAQDRHEAGYRLFSVAGLIASVSYGAPVFMAGVLYEHNVPIEYYGLEFKDTAALFSIETLILACLGIAAFILTFQLARPWFARRLPAFGEGRPMPEHAMLLLAWGLLLFGIAFYASPWIRSLPSVAQLGQPASMIAFAIFLTAVCRREVSVIQTVLISGCFGFIFFKLAVAASLPPILLYGLVSFFILWREFKRPPVWLVLGGVLFVSFTMQGFYIARTQIWDNGKYSDASALKKAQVVIAVAAHQLTGVSFIDLNDLTVHSVAAKEMEGGLTQRLTQRLSHLPHLAVGLQSLEAGRPLLRGETYLPMATSFIPRVFWPDKPREEVGRKFNHEYWEETNLDMSMNLPWMPELLINFGRLGVVFGMAFFGALFAFLYPLFNSARSGPAYAAVGLIILLPFVYPESNFSLMTGSLAPLALLMWLYLALGTKVASMIWDRLQLPKHE